MIHAFTTTRNSYAQPIFDQYLFSGWSLPIYYYFFNHEQHDDVDVGETGRINVDKTNY